MPLCPGCFKGFSGPNYLKHIQLSQAPRCHALYLALENHSRVNLNDTTPGSVPENLDVDMDSDNNNNNLDVDMDSNNDNNNDDDDDYTHHDDDDDYTQHGAGDGEGMDVYQSDEDADGDAEDLFHADQTLRDIQWEPPIDLPPADISTPVSNTPLTADPIPTPSDPAHQRAAPLDGERIHIEEALRAKLHVSPFPRPSAGAPIPQQDGLPLYSKYSEALGDEGNEFAPFRSRMDWDVARWAKLRGPGSTALSELLSIPGVHEQLGLSYKNARELNQVIDNNLPTTSPRFKRREIIIGGTSYDVYFRDVIECIRELYGRPEFASHLKFAPERHYFDPDRTMRVFHDMHTGKWWWEVQHDLENLKAGATVIPIIISSDKTQLTLFKGKSAYPVYLTIGNIPKDIRSKPSNHAQILLGYLPVAKLEHVKSLTSRRRMLSNMFHACMRMMLSPLQVAGRHGMNIASGDGVIRRGHPIFAAYVADYPEQILVTGCLTGDCPSCVVPRGSLGASETTYAWRDLNAILDAIHTIDTDPPHFLRRCRDIRIKPIYRPFWDGLPFADIFLSITPDILHQLYQGMVKHLFSWVKTAYSEVEIDARCHRLPPNHNVHHFTKGITTLSQLTGREHSEIAQILLGLIAEMKLPGGHSTTRLVRAIRALLDFLFLAQYPIHSTSTLQLLDDALERFHENKQVFVDLGIRPHFELPKLHAISHYCKTIQRLGTADNFNTQYTERLHIDLTKNAYNATNHKDEFVQMTTWLERKEKILKHEQYVKWRQGGCPPVMSLSTVNPQPVRQPGIKMTKSPTIKAVPLHTLVSAYGAINFDVAVSRFLIKHTMPEISQAQLRTRSRFLAAALPFKHVAVYHKARIWESDFARFRNATLDYDVIHAKPAQTNRLQQVVPGRFDTALVSDGSERNFGVQGHRVAQVRVIFSLPKFVQNIYSTPGNPLPTYLAYVEWFTPFAGPDPVHGLYPIARSMQNGQRVSSIVPLVNVRRSIHLFPRFGPVACRDWRSDDVLEKCSKFFVNTFTDRHIYGIII